MADKKIELAKIVGEDNVIDSLKVLEAYSRDQSFIQPMNPWLVVKPKNADDVQGIVKWANQTRTSLVPVSSGPPHFYGDTVPAVKETVIIDLSGMRKIIRIDRRNRIAVIEPGVTYGQIQPELCKEGLKLSTPLLPRVNKSVITSLLERQPTLTPKYQWSLLEPLRCLDVVLGNGEVLWTGEAGAHPHSLEQQWEKGLVQADPRGPAETDWYRLVSGAQGSMGIVTWASVKCEVLPKVHRLFFLSAPNLLDLIDCAYRLLKARLGDEFLFLNNPNLACLLGETADEIRTLKEEFPPWVILIGIAGRDILPEEKVETQEKDIRGIAQDSGLRFAPVIPGASGQKALDVLLRPSREPYWKFTYKGGCQDIFFLTTLDQTPGFVKTIYTIAEELQHPSSEIGIYIQPQHQGVACHFEISLPFDSNSMVEAARVKKLFVKASEEFIKKGAYFSRPYGIWANMAYNRDAQRTIILKEIKKVFDPNHVLNPGKLCF
jgi:FAD/FMN-containing dehydrogenase